MVEYTPNYDLIFQALADGTRRDVLRRVLEGEKTISELVNKYALTFAAIAKHVNVLARAGLVIKRRRGREQVVVAQPETIQEIDKLLKEYESLWNARLDTLEKLLKEEQWHETA